jgi:hypothetical protein
MNRLYGNLNISNLNLEKLIRISNQNDIDSIKCNNEDHKSPIYQVSEDTRIVVIGDIHGDLTALLIILLGTNLINNDLEWCGDKTYLVFTGDLLDNYRGGSMKIKQHPSDEITIISFLANLNDQAMKYQGRVLLCLGNHELMNIVYHQFDFVTSNTLIFFDDNLNSRTKQFEPNSMLRQKLSCLFEPFILINNKYFFCHAGLTPEFVNELNNQYPGDNILEKFELFSNDIKSIVRYGKKTDKNWIMKHMEGYDSTFEFFWTRYYGHKDKGCDIFNHVTDLLKLPDLILIKGHDMQIDNTIKESCNKKIYLIDTGISRAFQRSNNKLISDNMNFLEISNNTFSSISIFVDKSQENIYIEKLEEFSKYTIPHRPGILEKSGIIIKSLGNKLIQLYDTIPRISPYPYHPELHLPSVDKQDDNTEEITTEDWKKRSDVWRG